LTNAVAQFLERIESRGGDANWPTRVWLAQTYYDLGAGTRAGLSTAPPTSAQAGITPASGTARDFYVKSRDAYKRVLTSAAQDPAIAPNETAVLAAKVQLAECHRALGEFQQALDIYSSILKERESSLTVQCAAAYAYQDRGQFEDAKWFERAIGGGYQVRESGQNRIWGWAKISQVAARATRADAKYKDTFFEARLNIARCRYLAAMKSANDARQQYLAKAKQSIVSLQQLYPDLGGERWNEEFQTLLAQIQKAGNS
jgi:hypothetical protein